jgi:hypothetical protein
MIIFWTGWGIAVFFVTFAWIFVMIGVTIATGFHEPDPVKVAIQTNLAIAICFALSAASIFALDRYRAKRARAVVNAQTGPTQSVLRRDTFMFIPMIYWTHVLAAVAVWFVLRGSAPL